MSAITPQSLRAESLHPQAPHGKELQDKVCFIAGASGTIGSAVAESFRRHGARLAVTGHDQVAGGTCLANENAERPEEGRILPLRLNLRNAGEVVQAVEHAYKHFGRIDVLVNCAGVQGPIGPSHTLAAEDWARTIEINLLGSFYLTSAVIPIMLRQGGGKIIHFSGGGAASDRPFFTAYAASKAAVVRFAECLAEELRESNIAVNAIAPGPVRSRMWDEMRAAGAAAGERSAREMAQMDENGGVPPGRAAALAVFLASSRSDGLTGRLISGVHDRWEDFPSRIPEIMKTEGGTLRRVPLG